MLAKVSTKSVAATISANGKTFGKAIMSIEMPSEDALIECECVMGIKQEAGKAGVHG